MDREDQLEIRAEMDEQVIKELTKVCSPDEVDLMKEWIEEETNYCLYWTGDWINTTTKIFVPLAKIYDEFKISTTVEVDGGL